MSRRCRDHIDYRAKHSFSDGFADDFYLCGRIGDGGGGQIESINTTITLLHSAARIGGRYEG